MRKGAVYTRVIGMSIWTVILLGLLAVSACGAPAPNPDFGGEDEASIPSAKVIITTNGMYQITSQDLQALDQGWEEIPPETLTLLHRGDPQPVWISGEAGNWRLRFYGQAVDSNYAIDNGYLLTVNATAQKWIEVAQAPLPGTENPLDGYLATIHLEEDQRYFPKIDTGDHWLWMSLTAPQEYTFTFELLSLAPGEGEVRVSLWGSTEAEAEPDHHVRLWLDNYLVVEESWDGAGRRLLSGKVPQGVFREGENHLRLELPGDTGVLAETALIDWLEVDYPRYYTPTAAQQTFKGTGRSVTLSGAASPMAVFELSPAGELRRIALPQPKDTGVVLATQKEHTYIVVAPGGYLTPSALLPAMVTPNLTSPGWGADYLAIGPQDLLTPLDTLLDWREREGLNGVAVPVEAIYDQFNGGLPEPEAIRDFIRVAVNQWHPGPRYVLLVGDFSYDLRLSQKGQAAYWLPSFWFDTSFGGETVSDVLFAVGEDDPLPALAVGRVPAATSEEVKTFVEKTLAYESQGKDIEWPVNVLAIADGQAPTFKTDAQSFVDQFSGVDQPLIYAPPAGTQDAAEKIVDYLNAGVRLVAYFGHGSVVQWGKDMLFHVRHVAELDNADRLPIVVNWTCLTGLFTHPEVPSLAEALLRAENGGAVAVLAPTSLTLPQDQRVLSDAFAQAWLDPENPRLGDVVLQAWREISQDSDQAREMLYTFLLFGDPALNIPREFLEIQ